MSFYEINDSWILHCLSILHILHRISKKIEACNYLKGSYLIAIYFICYLCDLYVSLSTNLNWMQVFDERLIQQKELDHFARGLCPKLGTGRKFRKITRLQCLQYQMTLFKISSRFWISQLALFSRLTLHSWHTQFALLTKPNHVFDNLKWRL